MSEYNYQSVSILHCGGEEEIHFIKYLADVIAGCEVAPFELVYTKYQKHQVKETIMYLDARKYKKNGLPIIMLISKQYFDLMWLSPHKDELLDIIATTKHCLHIWLDVNEKDVKRRSNILLGKYENFRKINVHELTTGLAPSQNVEIANRLCTLLNGKDNNSNNNKCLLDNYAVDDEIHQMRLNFLQKTNATKSSNNNKVDICINKKKAEINKDVRRMASSKPEELKTCYYISEEKTSSKKRNKKNRQF